MEDIQKLVKEHQWLAKDQFTFTSDKRCLVGDNIFDRYKFRVCNFTLFESELVKLENTSLCEAYDYFEGLRLSRSFRDHFNQTTPESVFATEVIVHLYLDCLLHERDRHDTSNDIPDIRSELAHYAHLFPEINSNHLIAELEKSGIVLKQNEI